MTPYDPRDWWSFDFWFGQDPDEKRKPADLTREGLQRWALSLAFCACFAALSPADAVAATFSALAALAALASAVVAVLRREHPLAPRFTGWDEAALSLAVSLGVQLAMGLPGLAAAG
jgi:hypothetical protein